MERQRDTVSINGQSYQLKWISELSLNLNTIFMDRMRKLLDPLSLTEEEIEQATEQLKRFIRAIVIAPVEVTDALTDNQRLRIFFALQGSTEAKWLKTSAGQS
jgi:hypothetical protein